MSVEITPFWERLGQFKPVGIPQRAALECPADILKFGGSAGSLKSTTLLVDAVKYIDNPKYLGIIFRKSFGEMNFLIDRTHTLYSNLGGRYYPSQRAWRWPWGAKLEFSYMDRDQDVYKNQGPEYQFCTEVGTPVLMADGSYKPVDELVPGDLLQTLNGPVPVTHVQPPRLTQCVVAAHPHGSQVQSLSHALLTSEGEWLSYNDYLACEPIQYKGRRQSSSQFSAICQKSSNREYSRSGQAPNDSLTQLFLDQSLSKDASVCEAVCQNGISESDAIRQEISPLPVLYGRLALRAPDRRLIYESQPTYYAAPYEKPQCEVLSSQDGYRPFSHLCDERPLHQSTRVLEHRSSPNDAAVPTVNGYSVDNLQSSPKHAQREFLYPHPYTSEDQKVGEGVSVFHVPCRFTPCGLRSVVDITVSTHSQYITMGGFVNKNCGFDESTHHGEFVLRYIFNSRMRSTEGIPQRMRLATNPGNIGSGYHKAIFQGPRCTHCILRDAAAAGTEPKWLKGSRVPFKMYSDSVWPSDGIPIGGTTMFIPGKLTDHTGLLNNEQYTKRLKGMPKHLQEALLDGCWEAFEGQFFDNFTHEDHVCLRADVGEKEHWPYWISIDYGFSQQHAACSYLWTMRPDRHVFTLAEYLVHRRSINDLTGDLVKMWGHHNIKAWYLSHDAFRHDGGNDMSRAEQASQAHKIFFESAYNDRVSGAMLMYTMLQENQWSICGDACDTLVKSIPTRVHAVREPEDVEKVVEDEDDSFDACFPAETLVVTATGDTPICEIKTGDSVATREGWKRVVKSWKTGHKPCLTVHFSNGNELIGTANHPVFVQNKGFVRLDSLRYGDTLLSWQLQKQSYLAEKSSGGIQIPSTEASESTSTQEAQIDSLERNLFIKKYGKHQMGQSQKDSISTILMETPSTTRRTTSKPSSNTTICQNTVRPEEVTQQWSGTWPTSDHWRQNGTSQMSAENGILNMQKKVGAFEPSRTLNADNVNVLIPQKIGLTAMDFVPMPANLNGGAVLGLTALAQPAGIAEQHSSATSTINPSSVRDDALFVIEITSSGSHDVYNLEVEDVHEYFANGVLVHNCRYGLASHINPTDLPQEQVLRKLQEEEWSQDPTSAMIQFTRWKTAQMAKSNPVSYRGGRRR